MFFLKNSRSCKSNKLDTQIWICSRLLNLLSTKECCSDRNKPEPVKQNFLADSSIFCWIALTLCARALWWRYLVVVVEFSHCNHYLTTESLVHIAIGWCSTPFLQGSSFLKNPPALKTIYRRISNKYKRINFKVSVIKDKNRGNLYWHYQIISGFSNPSKICFINYLFGLITFRLVADFSFLILRFKRYDPIC